MLSSDKALVSAFDAAASLDDIYRHLDTARMKNGWAKPKPSLYPTPKQDFVAAHWSYTIAKAALDAAGRHVATEWAERRNLIMANPIPGNDYATVRTLVGAYQMVKAGEKARSHRHTPNAMRVVLEGQETTYTVVDGHRVPMLPGDVLLTPNGCWHGHDNASEADAYWIDFLDAPLVQVLGPMFFQHAQSEEALAPDVAWSSPLRVAFADYHPQLLQSREVAPGVRQLPIAPAVTPTFDRTVIHLTGGSAWKVGRSTVNQIFVVVRGAGSSEIGGQVFRWGAGDMIAAPSWLAQSHSAMRDSVLLRVSDEPLMRALGWLRFQTYEEEQGNA